MSGEVAFACEISEDRKHAAVVAAGREKDSPRRFERSALPASPRRLLDSIPVAKLRVVVDLVYYEHPRGVVAKLAELGTKHDPVATVIDPRSQAATLIRPLAEAGVFVTEIRTADVAVAHGEFLDLVNDGRLAHLDQPPLTAAVRAAQQRALAGAQAWERRLAVDQSPLTAATEACWAFLRWEELATPGVWAI